MAIPSPHPGLRGLESWQARPHRSSPGDLFRPEHVAHPPILLVHTARCLTRITAALLQAMSTFGGSTLQLFEFLCTCVKFFRKLVKEMAACHSKSRSLLMLGGGIPWAGHECSRGSGAVSGVSAAPAPGDPSCAIAHHIQIRRHHPGHHPARHTGGVDLCGGQCRNLMSFTLSVDVTCCDV